MANPRFQVGDVVVFRDRRTSMKLAIIRAVNLAIIRAVNIANYTCEIMEPKNFMGHKCGRMGLGKRGWFVPENRLTFVRDEWERTTEEPAEYYHQLMGAYDELDIKGP